MSKDDSFFTRMMFEIPSTDFYVIEGLKADSIIITTDDRILGISNLDPMDLKDRDHNRPENQQDQRYFHYQRYHFLKFLIMYSPE